tara:strand:+ start:447 stop:725 length:279 start_codon:yes stop_codon:yes gene_type:complete
MFWLATLHAFNNNNSQAPKRCERFRSLAATVEWLPLCSPPAKQTKQNKAKQNKKQTKQASTGSESRVRVANDPAAALSPVGQALSHLLILQL